MDEPLFQVHSVPGQPENLAPAHARVQGTDDDGVQPYVAQGYTLIVAGVDTLYLGQGAKALLSELRAAPPGA